MDNTMMSFIFLSAGLFMGWSLGANDAANIFGTAVGTRMVKFTTAAIIASVFISLGAFISGSGASHTLGSLGAINAIGGSFAVSASAAFTVMLMTGKGLPVSTSQAIVGAIIGWNIFSGNPTDASVLTKIASTWVFTPILAAMFAIVFFWIIKVGIEKMDVHLVKLYKYNRLALLLAGAFGAYSLGANNIANVMGVFINVSPFETLTLPWGGLLTSTQQLFLLGGLAIAVGVFTYSKHVMMTVGKSIFKLSPISAFIVVMASSAVLFLFASEGLYNFLTTRGLPAFPLVPVSQSQAVVGAIMGIGIAKGARGINYKQLLRIGSGWIMTPLISLIISLLSLYVLQNVFLQVVYY